ncbi:MAG: TIGR03982 family His-Xaa-Ser system protein [Emcibacteraceae bacterium]|nr:TIGR03982 family His-Xaa-Ser system protein [Emcibacteraceae bacterium]
MKNNLPIWMVAIIVCFIFVIEYVYPLALLWRQESHFVKSAIGCELAKNARSVAGDLEGQLESQPRSQLRKSIYISLNSCLEFQTLKEDLLSNGVNEHALKHLRLKALQNEQIPLNFAIRTLETEN